jgi:hypothetical protein
VDLLRTPKDISFLLIQREIIYRIGAHQPEEQQIAHIDWRGAYSTAGILGKRDAVKATAKRPKP